MQTHFRFVKRIWKIVLACILVCAGIFFFFKYLYQPIQHFDKTVFEMGTAVSISLYANNDQEIRNVTKVIHDLDTLVLSWRSNTSEVYALNENGGGNLSDTLKNAFEQCFALAKDTDGAFDFTLRNLIALWGIETDSPKVPKETDIKNVLENAGYENVVLENQKLVLQNGVQLDFGAMGKGYALDLVRDYLETTDVSGAVIAVGGSILTFQSNPEDRPWKIGIQDPNGSQGEYMLLLMVNGTKCISTSGDYEKYFEENGVKYHHIFDSKTGAPAVSDVRSVTVLCENGLVSDALSTACFVLGYENSLPVLKKYQAEAIFIMEDGSVVTSPDFSVPYEVLNVNN